MHWRAAVVLRLRWPPAGAANAAPLLLLLPASARAAGRSGTDQILQAGLPSHAPASHAACCGRAFRALLQRAHHAPIESSSPPPAAVLLANYSQQHPDHWMMRTVSQICSLICFWSMLIMRAPNSTPMVRSCTGWKRLSVNCSSRHDFPTPAWRRKERRGVRLRMPREDRVLLVGAPHPSDHPEAPLHRRSAHLCPR
mgnify:CR=1 FL=1